MRVAYPVKTTTAVALGVSFVLFGGGLLIGYSSFQELPALLSHSGVGPGDSPWSFGTIFTRNLSVIALMYAGVASVGVLSVITLAAVSLYVGATAKIGTLSSGAGTLATDVGLYAPVEFLGCLVAAAAGLYPVISAFSPKQQTENGGSLACYLQAVPRSLLLFVLASLLILLGAGLETLTLSQQGR